MAGREREGPLPNAALMSDDSNQLAIKTKLTRQNMKIPKKPRLM